MQTKKLRSSVTSLARADCKLMKSADLYDFAYIFQIELQKTWCVAKPSSSDSTLLENINYACSQVDCRILRKGCPCFSPDNLINHASIVMNLYYQCNGRNKWNCDFKNSALITMTDPSYGNCVYE
ncbi:hypothetical protein HYC85_014648 [Camellia sinensis]|uniref:X8 domain-containing protein n=1 Tax=Camellia sinensis TaxID=4442 RepID=A0A7J7H8U7_CAMSI|nr:hypothetical protein HYC85_014648 [Camellia sinensis]